MQDYESSKYIGEYKIESHKITLTVQILHN